VTAGDLTDEELGEGGQFLSLAGRRRRVGHARVHVRGKTVRLGRARAHHGDRWEAGLVVFVLVVRLAVLLCSSFDGSDGGALILAVGQLVVLVVVTSTKDEIFLALILFVILERRGIGSICGVFFRWSRGARRRR